MSILSTAIEWFKNTFGLKTEEDLYKEISLETCVEKRNSLGGASPTSVRAQVKWVKAQLGA